MHSNLYITAINLQSITGMVNHHPGGITILPNFSVKHPGSQIAILKFVLRVGKAMVISVWGLFHSLNETKNSNIRRTPSFDPQTNFENESLL